jgi:hypothetical protein
MATKLHDALLTSTDNYPPRAPSPPSMGYIAPRSLNEEVEVARTRQHEAVDGRGRPASVRRRRHSRSITERPASTFLRPGDEITVIERIPAPGHDYDWYDKDGMRVRVREI